MSEPAPKQHFVYMARCADSSLYTGYSKNVEQRLKIHNLGKGGRYTRAHRPLELLAYWLLQTQAEALRVEYAIKQLPRRQKLVLAAGKATPEWLSTALYCQVKKSEQASDLSKNNDFSLVNAQPK